MAESAQESLVDELLASAFGAPFIYRPQKYFRKNGRKQEEPVDLFWAHGNLVALVYMRESTEAIHKQIRHNQRQPHRYVRLWATRDERFVLKGTNRLGEETAIRFDDFKYLVRISVVSTRCGLKIVADDSAKYRKRGFTIIVSTETIELLTAHGFSIVDLLRIAALVHSGPSVAQNDEERFQELHFYLYAYFKRIDDMELALYDQDSPPDEKLLRRVLLPLAEARSSTHPRHANPERRMVAEILADMSLEEYRRVGSTVAHVLTVCHAPEFTHWCVASIENTHYSFVIAGWHLGNSEVQRNKMFNDLTTHNDRLQKLGKPIVNLQYYNMQDLGGDFRDPGMIAISDDYRVALQSEKMIEHILSLLENGAVNQ